jgi:hypothetical protein
MLSLRDSVLNWGSQARGWFEPVVEQGCLKSAEAKTEFTTYLDGRMTAVEYVHGCFIAPLYEEAFKRIWYRGWPVGFIFLVGTEFLGGTAGILMNAPPEMVSRLLIGRSLMVLYHLIWALLPYQYGVAWHSLVNLGGYHQSLVYAKATGTQARVW